MTRDAPTRTGAFSSMNRPCGAPAARILGGQVTAMTWGDCHVGAPGSLRTLATSCCTLDGSGGLDPATTLGSAHTTSTVPLWSTNSASKVRKGTTTPQIRGHTA